MFKKTLIYFLFWKLWIFSLALVATKLLPLNKNFIAYRNFGDQLPYLGWIWGNFDGEIYIAIARRGYSTLQQPFFPLYPLLIKIIHDLFHIRFLISAQLISNLCFFISLFILYKLLKIDKKQKLMTIFFYLLFIYPTTFFYGAIYNDAIFFLLATLTIFFARKQQWFVASISGAFAALARLNGLALFIFLLTEFFLSVNKVDKNYHYKDIFTDLKKTFSLQNILQTKMYAVLIIPVCFTGYLCYVQWQFGDWHSVFSAMKIWNQDKVVLPPQVIWRYIKILFIYPSFHNLNYYVALVEFLFVMLYITVSFYSLRRIRFSYWIFMVISFIIPSLTGTFQGMPRYGLHLYPLFLSLAIFLHDKNIAVKIIYSIISFILLLFCITLFTRGYFIA